MISPADIRKQCLLCGGNSFKHIFDQQHFLIKCNNCGLVTTNTIPSSDELKKYYDEYPSYDLLAELTLHRYNLILDKLENFRETNNLLESGCGYGLFLEEAKKRKWNVFGTELSEKALDECKSKNIFVRKTISEILEKTEKPFDAVVSLEVIEHLSDPVKEIETYSAILRPGGAVYITTPNFNSFSRRLFGKKWNVILYPEHLNYFTAKTIRRLMNKFNFKKINHLTSGFSYGRLVYSIREKKHGVNDDLKNYDYNGKDRELRDSIEKNFLLRLIKNIANSILSFFKAGDTLKILYKKK